MDSGSKYSRPSTTNSVFICLQEANILVWGEDYPNPERPPTPKGTIPCNYRPITCLPMLWKILTVQTWGRDLILVSMAVDYFPKKRILKESKARRKKVVVTWIENKKTLEMISQCWIVDCLKMYKISDKDTKFITKPMKNWKVELTERKIFSRNENTEKIHSRHYNL